MFFGRRKKKYDQHPTIEQRVARGIALLDQAKPGWDRRINLFRLDIARGDRCALGQVYGDYGDGAMRLGLSERNAVQHGFQAKRVLMDQATVDAEFDALTDEWRKQIQVRRHSHHMDLVTR